MSKIQKISQIKKMFQIQKMSQIPKMSQIQKCLQNYHYSKIAQIKKWPKLKTDPNWKMTQI